KTFDAEGPFVGPRRAKARDRAARRAQQAPRPVPVRFQRRQRLVAAHCVVSVSVDARPAGPLVSVSCPRSDASRGRSNGNASSRTRGSVSAFFRNSKRSRSIVAVMLNVYVLPSGRLSRSALGAPVR